jgi:CheY-specific phosphatase CheX
VNRFGNVSASLREISKTQLLLNSPLPAIAIKEASKELPVHSHWMSLIMVAGTEIKVIFKVHFKSAPARLLASKIYGVAPAQVQESQALDYFKEYCNLNAGSIKKILSKNGFEVGVSLPVLTRGFDEIFNTQSQIPGVESDCWELGTQELSFVCTSTVELFGEVEPQRLNLHLDRESKDNDTVEFF